MKWEKTKTKKKTMKSKNSTSIENAGKEYSYDLLFSDNDGFYLISNYGFHIRVDENIFNILIEKGLIIEK